MQFNQELSGLIDVLKGIASSQFRHLQAKREYFARFNRCLDSFFEILSMAEVVHPFLNLEFSLSSSCIVMLTSDEGFLGELNSRVINAGLNQRRENDTLIVLGERGANSLEELGESFLYFPGITEEIKHEQAEELRDYLIQGYLNKKFGKVVMVYPKFISFAIQEVKTEQLLPYPLVAGERELEPKIKEPEFQIWQTQILVEPSAERIVDYLIRLWMMQNIYDLFWESKLSECAARVIHLEESSQVVAGLNKKLQFSYFRLLHQLSDNNIREIFASRVSAKIGEETGKR
jgi:F-type H+-transporting ATPase subunit gamma